MAIDPISSNIDINRISSLIQNTDRTGSDSEEVFDPGFGKVLRVAIENVEKTEAATEADAYNLSIGKMDDMHTMMINAAKADLALQTFVQLRNKALEAYSEIMRTNL